jgi:hypothetical protein
MERSAPLPPKKTSFVNSPSDIPYKNLKVVEFLKVEPEDDFCE